jgi:hypothetical protein
MCLVHYHSERFDTKRRVVVIAFKFTLDYQERLNMNGKHQLLVFADDINVLGDNIHTIKT